MSIFLDLISAPIRFLYYVLEIEIGTPANGVFGLFAAIYYLMIFIAILGGAFFFIVFIFNKINEHFNYLVVTNLGESKTIKNLQEKIKTRDSEIEVKKGGIEGWVKELELKEIKLESTGKEVGKLSRQINQKKLSKSQEEIKEYVESRGVDKLIHFTQYKNIESILKHGLITKSNLDKLGVEYFFNDNLRLDNREDSISLSVSYPNSAMLYKYRHYEQYVVLVVDPSVLWEYECVFCYDNAATTNIAKTPMKRLTTLDAFKAIFQGGEINRKLGTIKRNEPTNIQAEVLVLNNISIDKILEIHFSHNDNTAKQNEIKNNKLIKDNKIKVKASEVFFQWK